VGRSLLAHSRLLEAFGDKVICASFCKRIQPDSSIYDPNILYLSMQEGYDSGETEQFQVQSTGISNFKWPEYLSQIHRVVAPISIQQSFRQHVEPILDEIILLGLGSEQLRETRELLLPQLLSGQILSGE